MEANGSQSHTPMAESVHEKRICFRSGGIDHVWVVATASSCAIVGGVITLLGWILEIPRFTDWANTGISMFPNTALCASISGVALLLLSGCRGRPRWRTAVRILAIFVAVIGGLTLLQHIFEWNFGIDTLLLVRSWGQRSAAAAMRMGPPASTSFFILGSALLLATDGPKGRRVASTLAILPFAISSLSLIGYCFGANQLYTAAHLTAIALQTSAILALLAIGLMAAIPEYGIATLLCRSDAGGMLVRRLLLPIIIVPVLIGWLRLQGEQAGIYDTAFGSSLMSLTTIAMLLALLAWTAISVGSAAQATQESRDQLEAVLKKDISDRMRAEQAIREREQRYELVLLGAEAAIWDWDVLHERVMYSPRWKQLRGLSDAEVSDSVAEWSKRIHPEDYDRVMAAVRDHFEQATSVFNEEYRVQHKDGHWIWVLDRGIARRDEAGQVVRMAGSETDITERKQLEDQLRQRVEELAVADRRKDEFLAMLAHELRNPLAPIRTGLEILKVSKDDRQTLQEVRNTMERQLQQLITLVDDLLDVSRITRGKLELRKCRVSVAEIVQSAVEASRTFIDEAGHQLTVTVPNSPLVIEADPSRLAQILSNLLNNAAKYTPAGGQIRLTAEREGSDLLLSVKDTGIGIPADMQERVFEMFSQLDHPLEKAHSGLGIGLTLVKLLVEMHGGRIELHSEGADRGSEFRVRLPISIETSCTETLISPELPAAAEGTIGLRILVVDDNKAAADLLSMMVRMFGNEVRSAYDGLTGIQIAAEFQPDVVLLDIGMPKMNGYEVARHMREQPGGARIVLVAVTGWGQEADKQRTTESGFDYHLVKPAEPAELRRLLSTVAAERIA